MTGAGARERGPPRRGGSGAPAARPAQSPERRGEGPPGPDAAGGAREATARRGAEPRLSCLPDVLKIFLITLAIGFHCLQKIKIAPEIGEFDLKEKT